MDSPRLQTARLRLRPYTIDDIDAMHGIWTNGYVRRYLWDDRVIEREVAEEHVRANLDAFDKRGFAHFLLATADDPSPIGFCGYSTVNDEPELMYGLLPEYAGQGLCTEASRAVLDWGFETLGFDRVVAGADAPNAASLRVMERLGMRYFQQTLTDIGLIEIWYELPVARYRPT